MSPPLSVLMVQQQLAHYRRGVFMELDRSPALKVTFAADLSSTDGNIPAIPRTTFKRVVPLKNFWLGPLLWQRGLLRCIARGQFDCVIFTGDVKYISTWLALLLARLRGARTYHWTIGWHRPDSTKFRGMARKLFYRLADRVLLYGEDGYRIGAEAGFPTDRMSIIGNSYSQAPSASTRTDRVLDLDAILPPGRTRFVGAVVRLNHEKRLDMLISAVDILRRQGRDISVLLTGSGPAEDPVAKEAERLGVPLYLTGAAYDDATISAVYHKLDVTVLPERAGLTVMQSLIHGTPVVTVDDPYHQVPEFRAVIPGVTGVLYPRGNVDALAAAIDQCLTMVDQQGDSLADACRDEIEENWSVVSHAHNIMTALNEPGQ